MKDLNLNSNKFAENQLKKFGWKEGEGIGKTNQGIADPIKASFKFDNTGVGFNVAEEFTVNWWEHLYNSTANKIDTNHKSTNDNHKSNDKINDEKEKCEVETNSILNRKNYFYSRFTKGSLLINGETKQVEEKLEKPKEKTTNNGIKLSEIKKGKLVSDEELFKVCEGRTAHKGARHGIKMNGKLARIQEQERILTEQLTKKLDDKNKNSQEFEDQKEKKRKNDNSQSEDLNTERNISNEDKNIKKKKKKQKSNDEYE